MRKTHFAVLFFVLLAFGLSFTIPAQDLPETAYDESEADPYEPAPLISHSTPVTAGSPKQPAPSPSRSQSPNLFAPAVRRISLTEAPPPVGSRVGLALLCSLLC